MVNSDRIMFYTEMLTKKYKRSQCYLSDTNTCTKFLHIITQEEKLCTNKWQER